MFLDEGLCRFYYLQKDKDQLAASFFFCDDLCCCGPCRGAVFLSGYDPYTRGNLYVSRLSVREFPKKQFD